MATKSLAAIKRYRTARLASLATRAYYLHRRNQEDRMYTLICDEFVKLGGVYVKFLQGVLLQSAAMRKWQNPDRLRVFENLDHEPIDIIKLLRKELSPQKLRQISSVQPQPFAAGSFGQVYYAQHSDGTAIVIKVLRPMVRELLRYDLKLLGVFSKSFAGRMTPNMDLKIDEAIKDFRTATLRETDYAMEAQFADEMYQHYKDHPAFIIPRTYLNLCTTNIIVQEYIGGISVAQLIRLKEQGVDPKTYVMEQTGSDLDIQLTILGMELFIGIFNLDRIQGDPHPGNIRLLEGNKVGVIDFGISAPTPKNKAAVFGLFDSWSGVYDSNQDDLVNLFEQFMRFFVSDLYRALKKISSIGGDSAQDDLTKSIGRIAQDTLRSNLKITDMKPLFEDGRALAIMNNIINKDNRFGLVVRLEASEILRAAQTYMTLVAALDRRNFVFPDVFNGVVKSVETQHPNIRNDSEDAISMTDALDIVSRWLERVATRDPVLFRQLMNRIKLKGRGSINV